MERAPTRVATPSGVTLIEHREDAGARLELRAPDGALVLEYRPAEGLCRIHAPRVEVEAHEDLRLAGRRVAIEAREAIALRAGASRLAIEGDAVKLEASELSARVARVGWVAEVFRVTSDHVETHAQRLVQHAGEIETHARQIVEHAHETFREVKELAQTRAGRLRLVAEDALRLFGRRTAIKAREDLMLTGEHIYLD
ncbi:MAG: DUF3540 domain-containing protein [Sandaracinaceae bacterium]|nr:DUF3540 domain-containing protein [Sandaracinaceae bacterium]